MDVYIHFPNGVMTLKQDTPLLLGRGKYGITNKQVSREHLKIYHEKNQVFALCLSQSNPAYVWKTEKSDPIILRYGEKSTIENDDKVSLLASELYLTITINTKNIYDSEATQKATTLSKRKFVKTPSFEQESTESPKKKQKVIRTPLKRTETSFIHPKNQIGEFELTLQKVIGTGSCGEVWKANWNGNTVAVKKIFRALLTDDAYKEFRSEAKILSSLRHPNVVQFWGFSNIKGDNCIVTEFMPKGALNDVIYGKDIPFKMIIKYALGAAEGIRYLHTQDPPIVHRDIKTMNFLVGADNCVKVSDFGLAKHMQKNTTQTFCGTVPWTAPELLSGQEYTTKVDVYSFGIVLWELCARKMPYEGLSQSQIIINVINKGLRPTIPQNCHKGLSKLMQICWHQDPSCRPTMKEVIGNLKELSEYNINEINNTTDTRELESMELTLTKPKHPIAKKNEITYVNLIIKHKFSQLFAGNYNSQNVLIQIFDKTNSNSKDEYNNILDILTKIQSPSLLGLTAFGLDPLQICFEKMDHSLRSFLSLDSPLVLRDAVCLMLECTKAFTIIHTWDPCLLHRDLTSASFFLSVSGGILTVKIGNLSYAKFIPESNTQSLRLIKGDELEYCAPECFDFQGCYTTKSDVYSFGIIMWEIMNKHLTGSYKKPYFDIPDTKGMHFMTEIVKKLKRPQIPNNCPPELEELISLSWHPVVEERPDFAYLSSCLNQVLCKLDSNST